MQDFEEYKENGAITPDKETIKLEDSELEEAFKDEKALYEFITDTMQGKIKNGFDEEYFKLNGNRAMRRAYSKFKKKNKKK